MKDLVSDVWPWMWPFYILPAGIYALRQWNYPKGRVMRFVYRFDGVCFTALGVWGLVYVGLRIA